MRNEEILMMNLNIVVENVLMFDPKTLFGLKRKILKYKSMIVTQEFIFLTTGLQSL